METYDDNVNTWAGVRRQQKSMGTHMVVVGEGEGEGRGSMCDGAFPTPVSCDIAD